MYDLADLYASPLTSPTPFSPLPQSPSSAPLWVVLANYEATESGMLTVYTGELVEVIDISRNEWCLVKTTARDTVEGWVPAAYLKPYDSGGYGKLAFVTVGFWPYLKGVELFSKT